MNILSQKILVKNNDANKYGWTDNVKMRYCYEVLHDEKTVFSLIQKNPDCLKYFLKRLIVTKRFNKFIKLMDSLNWTDEHKEFLNYLLYLTVKYVRFNAFNYLINKFKFDIDYRLASILPSSDKINNKRKSGYKKLKSKLYLIAYPVILDTVTVNSLENLSNIAFADKYQFMLWCIFHALEKFRLDSKEDKKSVSVKELVKYFGY